MNILPGSEVRGAIQPHAPAFGTLPGTDAHVLLLTLLPKAGITKARQLRIPRGPQDGRREFGPGQEKWIAAGCKALGFEKIMRAIAERGVTSKNRPYAGVQNGRGSGLIYGAAREAAILIWSAR